MPTAAAVPTLWRGGSQQGPDALQAACGDGLWLPHHSRTSVTSGPTSGSVGDIDNREA